MSRSSNYWERFLESKSRAVAGIEDAVLIEFRDEVAAALVAGDSQAGKHCRPAGGKWVAAPKKSLRAFRSAIRKFGFVIPDERLPS